MSSSPADLETPTHPEDCGLAIALPLSKEKFRSDISDHSTNHDYASQVVGTDNWETVWEEEIKPTAEFNTELVLKAKDLGVDVRESATLDDLTQLFKSRSVVTIVTHWRGHNLEAQDLRVPAQSLSSRILHGSDDTASALRSRIKTSKLSEIESSSDAEKSAEDLIELLNGAIGSTPLLPVLDIHSEFIIIFDDVELPAANRLLLDQWAEACLRPGNRLELRDGLHSAIDIERIIPIHFSGIIHFATCYSTVLGNQIRKTYPNRRVIMNTSSIKPLPQLLVLQYLYQQLEHGEYNYGQILPLIHSKLKSLYDNK